MLTQEEVSLGGGYNAIDPTEEMYIKTLSSFKFQIGFEELRFNSKHDLIAKSSL